MIVQGATVKGGSITGASIVIPELAIYIDANNLSSYPGSGTTVSDLSGNGRTQTLTSAGAYTVLSGVKCFNMSTNNYLTANVTGPVLPTTGFTYITWVRLLNNTSIYRTFFRSSSDHPIIVNIGTNTLGMYDNGTSAFYSAGYNVSSLVDVWAQYAVVGDSAGQTYYINGQQVGTTVQSAAGNSHSWTGNAPPGGQSCGYMANMFLYTSALTQPQIYQNYLSQKGTFGL